PVERVPRTEKDDLRAAAEGLGRAHRRADAEPPRDVVRGGDDPATVRVTSDGERPRPQRRILELLHGSEERVEIQMGEYRHGAVKATVRPSSTALTRHDTLRTPL